MDAAQPLTALAATGLFILVHLVIGRLTILSGTPRSRWLSVSGGIAVAYVFLHLLPEVAVHRQTLGDERAVYAVALAGLVVFYGLERAVKRAHQNSAPPGVYHLHLGAFAAYNLLIGVLLLHREEPGLASLALYAMAMALHFVTTDFGLREDHAGRYDRHGRWLLSAAVLAGWAIGWALPVPATAVALLFGFLSGGVVLNVLKEELPRERASRFGAFLAGAAGYGALLFLV